MSNSYTIRVMQKVRQHRLEVDSITEGTVRLSKKKLICENLIELRKQHGLSQHDLAKEPQIRGCDMDKNVITRIEMLKRNVSDIELQKWCEVLT